MANRTVKDAHTVKGTNPQYLVEKITRSRIYECKYWKEQCFALSAELLVDKAMEMKSIGGVYGGNIKPTPFICLILKMLQIQPEKDIVIYFLTQQEYKYARALGALYLRLTGTSLDCFKYLEPLYLDYRKIRRMNRSGTYEVLHMDEYIDELLHEERVCDIILPRIQKRHVLEETNQLEARVSALDDDLEDMDTSEEEADEEEEEGEFKDAGGGLRPPTPDRNMGNYREWDRPPRHGGEGPPRYQQPRNRSPPRRRGGSRERERDRDHDRDRHRRRHRSRERHRPHKERERPDRERTDKHSKRHKDVEEDRHHHHRSKKSKREKEGGATKEAHEIREANELRAKLGLAPLRP